MVYKVFLDTNIFLDHFLGRNEQSTQILDLCEKGEIIGFASSASFFTIAYFLEKQKEDAREILRAYSGFIEFIPTSKENLFMAYNSLFKDLEDSFQYYTALNEQSLKFFITRNIDDYKSALHKLQVLTPEAFLNKIYEKGQR